MDLVGSVFVVLLFAVLLYLLKLVPLTAEVVARSRDSVAVLRDPVLDDNAKEKRLQAHALRLFKLLGLLILGSAVAVLFPVAAAWLVDLAGLWSLDGVLTNLMRWDFMTVLTVIGFGAYAVIRSRRS